LIAKWLELDLTDPLVKAEIDAALQSPGVQRTERDGRTFYHIPSEYLALRIQEIGDTALKAAHELLAEEGRKMYGRQNKE
jgi:hypothetical protein